MFSTRMTTFRDFHSPWFAKWKHELHFEDRIHRKLWEVAIVFETLDTHGVLAPGRRGVGFGVGSETFVTALADKGPFIVATDLLPESWTDSHKDFFQLGRHPSVENRIVDMNWIDGASGQAAIEEESADFTWSICSMDHCGSIWWTKRFLLNQMNCLRMGGIAVHTAEYTIGVGLPREGPTVWLDRDDVVDVIGLLTKLGHEVAPVDWFIGDSFEDHGIDTYPYDGYYHLKAETHGRWGTCICFAIRKIRPGCFWVPIDETEARIEIDRFCDTTSMR